MFVHTYWAAYNCAVARLTAAAPAAIGATSGDASGAI